MFAVNVGFFIYILGFFVIIFLGICGDEKHWILTSLVLIIYICIFVYTILHPYPKIFNEPKNIDTKVVKVDKIGKDNNLYTFQSKYGRFNYYNKANKFKINQTYQLQMIKRKKYFFLQDEKLKINYIKPIKTFKLKNDVNTKVYSISRIYHKTYDYDDVK